MSERIREAAVALIGALAEQAGAGWDHKYHWYVGSETMQKFAELIVRECANICEIESETYKYSFTPSKARLATSTSKHCATMIKRYFGLNNDEP